jgi:hypothetical protein
MVMRNQNYQKLFRLTVSLLLKRKPTLLKSIFGGRRIQLTLSRLMGTGGPPMSTETGGPTKINKTENFKEK